MSSVCALHCLVMPLVMTSASIGAFALLASEDAEAALLSMTTLMAISVLGWSFAHHRRPAPLGLFTLGMALIVAGRILVTEIADTPLVVAGSLMFTVAHLLNSRACWAARCGGYPCIDPPRGES